jgi:hypothetical protein
MPSCPAVRPPKKLTSTRSINSNHWAPALCALVLHQKPLSMMASDTSWYSQSGTPMPRPRFIGDRRTATPEQQSSPARAFRAFKRLENSNLRPSANQIGRLNTDTCCLALGNKNTLLPLFPQKRTWFRTIVMSALCHYATFATSFDHFVGAREQHRRHGEGERLGGLEINDQLEFGRLFNR